MFQVLIWNRDQTSYLTYRYIVQYTINDYWFLALSQRDAFHNMQYWNKTWRGVLIFSSIILN